MTRVGFAAATVLVAIALVATVGPLLWTIPPEATNPAQGLAGASAAHPLGTDDLGRDLLSRLLYGARVSLGIGVTSVLLALAAGVPLGLITGYLGATVDEALMRLLDSVMALPARCSTSVPRMPARLGCPRSCTSSSGACR